MKLSEFTRNYSLHDSPIVDLCYSPEQGKLILEVEICDDGQWVFLKGKADPFPIQFIFTGVARYTVDGDDLDFESDEIYHASLIPSKNPTKEALDFLIITTPNKGIKHIQIEAECIYWNI